MAASRSRDAKGFWRKPVQDGQVRVPVAQAPGEFGSVAVGHGQVDDGEVPPAPCIGGQRQRFAGARGRRHLEACAFEETTGNAAYGIFVVDDECAHTACQAGGGIHSR
jgi:hypothetical protein